MKICALLIFSLMSLLSLPKAALAVEELALDELKKFYPPCREGEVFDQCFGELLINNPAKQRNVGVFVGGELYTGNVYEYSKFAASCRERDCKWRKPCSYSIIQLKYTCTNGDSFWGFSSGRDGRKQGKGTYIWSNGNKFEGDAKDDLWEGNGTKTFYNGDVYRGEFRRDLMHGRGLYRFANGDIYQGSFFEGMFDGHGELHFADGDRYVGEFKKNKRNGFGIFYYRDGAKQEGRWINGEYMGR